jgi:hypothetical protein
LQGPLSYAWSIVGEEFMAGKTSSRKPKTRKPVKAKRSIQSKSTVQETEDSIDIRERQDDTYNPWAYFAKYFDQI